MSGQDLPAAPAASGPPRRVGRPHPRLDSYKRTWYFLRRNTLALFGLGVILFFVFVALYAATQPLPYFSMNTYCATNYTNPTVATSEASTAQVPGGMPNGTYSFVASASNGFVASPASGSFRVQGAPVYLAIAFTSPPRMTPSLTPAAAPSSNFTPAAALALYPVTFAESGLPAYTVWQVSLNYTSPNLCLSTQKVVCTYPKGSVDPGPGCYETPPANPSDIAPTLNLAKFSAGPLPLGSLTLSPSTSAGFYNVYQGILRGADWSLTISVAIVGGGALIGLLVGSISGFYGGVVDEALMRLVDIFLSIPQILFVIVVIAVITQTQTSLFGLGPASTRILLLIFGFLVTWWPFYARVVRGQVLVVREQKYVESARAAGAGRGRIIRKHIIPNSVYPVFIQMSLDVGTIPLLLGVLIYLGFNIFTTPYFPEWGALSANSVVQLQNFLNTCTQVTGCIVPWWQFFFPGLVVFMFAISVNFLSDGLRDALDPRLRR
jgi:peptide/nickel transport system permease protein